MPISGLHTVYPTAMIERRPVAAIVSGEWRGKHANE